MVIKNRPDFPSERATFSAISKHFGRYPETLKTWVRKTQVDTGTRPGGPLLTVRAPVSSDTWAFDLGYIGNSIGL